MSERTAEASDDDLLRRFMDARDPNATLESWSRPGHSWTNFGERTKAVVLERLEKAVLARQAYDVMLRRAFSMRPWYEGPLDGTPRTLVGWEFRENGDKIGEFRIPCPFAAIVAADAWMTEQETKGR